MTPAATDFVDLKHFQFFCGSGGMALGFNQGHARVGATQARWRCIGGIDVSPTAIKDFTRLSGVEGTVLDLFDYDQFRDFHAACVDKKKRCPGCSNTGNPPVGWRPVTAEDIRRAAHGERPNAVALSAPCKGFSGLLNKRAAGSLRYQALNRLTLRGIRLMLEAWADDPPELIIFENVPRIRQRGRDLLDDIVHELEMAGYAVAETAHDCGELGGLAQHRPRYLLVARLKAKVPAFLYEPQKKRVRAVGEVLSEMPLPDDPAGGQMHRSPLLEWRTWVRLALIPAGGDWRSLEGMDFSQVGIQRTWHAGVLGVHDWKSTIGVVPSRSTPTNGAFSVADPRQRGVLAGDRRFNNTFRIVRMDEPAGAVTGGGGPSAGGQAVADPRSGTSWEGKAKYRVTRMDEPTGAVIAVSSTGNGAFAVADDRPPLGVVERDGHVYGVSGWGDAAECITSATGGVGSGRFSVQDPREEVPSFTNLCRVEAWDGPSHCVVGASRPAGGALSVQDPRWGGGRDGVLEWSEPAGTVQGDSYPSNGAFSVSDPRVGMDIDRVNFRTQRHYGVIGFNETSDTVSGSACCDNGNWSGADPREHCELTPNHLIVSLPDDDEQLDPAPIIIALDGTRHRPFTTLELAALQGLPWQLFMLSPMAWSGRGKGDTTWREHVGNMVPPPTAAAIASVMAHCLLLARAGVRFVLSAEPIWVQRIALSMAIGRTDERASA